MERSNRLALLPSIIPILLISSVTFLGNLIVFYLSNKLNHSFQPDLIYESTTTNNLYLSNNELLTKLISSIIMRWSLLSSLIALTSFIILLIKPSNTTIIRIFNLSSFLDFSINFLLVPTLAFFSLHPIFSTQFSSNLCEILTRNELLLGSTSNLKFASSRTSQQDLIVLTNDLERGTGGSYNNDYFSNGYNGSNSWGIESCEETWWKVIFLSILFLTGLVLIRGMMLGVTMDYVSRVELIMRDVTSSSGIDGEEKGDHKNLVGGSDEKGSSTSSSSSSTRRLGRASTLPTGRSSSRSLGRYKSNTISHPSNSSTSPPRTVLVPIFYEPKSSAPLPSTNTSTSYYETTIPQSQYLPTLFPSARRFSASSTTSSTTSSSTRSSLRHFHKSNLLPPISGSIESIASEVVEDEIVEEKEEEGGDEFDKSL